MNTSRHTSNRVPATAEHTISRGDNPDLRPLLKFVATALPVGWVLLSVPLFVDVPIEPFVLGTLYLGLVLPTVLLTRRDPDASMR